MLDDVSLKRLAGDVRNNTGDDVAIPGDHAEHNGFVLRVAARADALLFAADKRLVDLNMTAKRRIGIDVGQILADLHPHPVRRFVINRELPL